ncbi:DnrO protein [Rhodanobacter glycinis]|uniref:DnrO protein n=1 Tax=Rhodanobacter glycinis TaxID=582702 RepID=A0A502CDB0_9GAMM|nr:DnrO protein [Rhodanobacter glycinis]TPG11157.1 DnrO protein [Rhodanobacter glycinis]TPG48646.1 DnrO protein [Rhodanobacter glycinis]
MKFMKAVLALACGLSLAMTAYAAPGHVHESHAAHAATTAVSTPAQRWTPDASLRDGMRRVHAAVDELRHYEMGHMSAPMAVDRATSVEEAVTFMFAHCKLAAEPDAALHGILVPLLSAAQTLKADPKKVGAVADMRAAIAHYPQYFNDPGWDQPAPVEHVMHDEP